MSKALPAILYSGLSEKTVDKYLSGWNNWLHWCKQKDEISPRPADPFHVAIYLNHLLFVTGKHGSQTAAFYGIRWGHHVVGLKSPTDHPFVKLAFEGCQRLSVREKNRKVPMSPETIKQIVDKFTSKINANLLELRTVVVCLLGFSGFFRIEELLTIQLKEVSISRDYLKIVVPKSKTGQHRDGHEVFIARLPSQYCPVAYVETFLAKSSLDLGKHGESFLIPRIAKTKKGHRAVKGKGISYSRIREVFKSNLKNVVSEVDQYGLHSLRSGGASAAAANEVADRMISKHGRWASTKGRNSYIKYTINHRLKIFRSLNLLLVQNRSSKLLLLLRSSQQHQILKEILFLSCVFS